MFEIIFISIKYTFWKGFFVSNNTVLTSSNKKIDKGEVGGIRGMDLSS